MSNVALTIGGRTFSVACADGEEDHITFLGGLIDERVKALGTSAGQNEVRMLLYAALVLADDLHEATSAPAPAATAPASADGDAAALATRLERIAGLIENLADHLERAPLTP